MTIAMESQTFEVERDPSLEVRHALLREESAESITREFANWLDAIKRGSGGSNEKQVS